MENIYIALDITRDQLKNSIIFSYLCIQDGTILDEKDIASLSLVDAVIHHGSNLKLRPSHTKVEPTSSQNSLQGGEGRAGEPASKGDSSGQPK